MNVLVLGGGYAGVTCALRLARATRGQARVTLVNTTDHLVQRIRLHEDAAGRAVARLALRPLLARAGVRFVVGAAEALDLDGKRIVVAGEAHAYDHLVLALGSRIDDAVPGAREHAYALGGDGPARLAARVPELAARGGRVVVVGGGLSGLEGATELAEAHPGLRVTLLSHGPLGAGWSAAARAHFLAACARLGVTVREGVRVERVEAGQIVTAAGPVPFDACLWGAGLVGAALPAGADLARNEHGRVLVDACFRALGRRDVHVVGDLAAPVEPTGDPLPMGCKSALPLGAHVAENLARRLRGEAEQPFDFALAGYCVSLGRRDGVIQLAKGGGPLGAVLTGRLAAWIKELICRSTVWSLAMEARGIPAVVWAKTGRVARVEADARRVVA